MEPPVPLDLDDAGELALRGLLLLAFFEVRLVTLQVFAAGGEGAWGLLLAAVAGALADEIQPPSRLFAQFRGGSLCCRV